MAENGSSVNQSISLDEISKRLDALFGQQMELLKQTRDTVKLLARQNVQDIDSDQQSTISEPFLSTRNNVVHSRTKHRGRREVSHHRNTSYPTTSSENTTVQLRNELDQCSRNLTDVRDKLQESESKLDAKTSELERIRDSYASVLKQYGKFSEAAAEYQELVKLKKEEVEKEIRVGDTRSIRSLRQKRFTYEYQYAYMLFQAGKYSDALPVVEQLTTTLTEFHNDEDLQMPDTRDAYLLYGTILRKLGTDKDLERAERLYERASSFCELNLLPENDRTWKFRNNYNLAYIKARQGFYSNSVGLLIKIWPHRSGISEEYRKVFKNKLDELAKLFKDFGQYQHAWKVVSLLYDELNKEDIIPEKVEWLLDCGKELNQQEDYSLALKYLQRAREYSDLLKPNAIRPILSWNLACALCHEKKWDEAEPTLKALQAIDNSGNLPQKHQVQALLAAVRFHKGDWLEAEKISEGLFNSFGYEPLEGVVCFNQIDMLIRALSSQGTSSKLNQAITFWGGLYAARFEISFSTNGRDRLRIHTETGEHLAEKLKDKKSRIAIEKQTKEVQSLADGTGR